MGALIAVGIIILAIIFGVACDGKDVDRGGNMP